MRSNRPRFHSNYIISRSYLYSLLALLINLGFALLITGGTILLLGVPFVNQLWVTGVCIFIIALLFNPVRQYLEKFINKKFFKTERNYQVYLQNFSSEITNAVNTGQIVLALWQYIKKYLFPEIIHIYLFDQQNNTYESIRSPEGEKTSDILFTQDSSLVQLLGTQKNPLIISSNKDIPSTLQNEKNRIEVLNSCIFLPLHGSKRLNGWVSISNRISGEKYHSADIFFMESLSNQAAIALDRIQIVSNLENRVREMDVLASISEGVNITLSIDDILELIYAQTSRVIQSEDFHIQLFDQETNAIFYLFFVEKNDRLIENENRFFSGENTLEYEVIQSQRPIITENYANEHRKRGLTDNIPDLKSWICVPLNSGAETIGALSLGSRRSDITYTSEQIRLLEAIADQAAGAIVKSRLLAESERRAQQFITLNEVARQFSATFEIDKLLQIILENAVNILNCEAGSLLLQDDETNELVFAVTTGPVAGELLNKRLPPGVGVVGKSVKTRQPVIVNNIQSAIDWYSQTDKLTGYKTEGLLVIPLIFQENIIGAIEVLNKNNKTPFNKDDQVLLEAFAAQAAVAITNARLYTMTDQELSSRVEELSIMQRIDRELNARLDAHSPMTITLEWAMRQSGARAGFVGAVKDTDILVMASQGYADELNESTNLSIPLEKFNPFAELLIEGHPQNMVTTENTTILKDAQSQAIIPIRRENKTIGMILLVKDSPEVLSEEVMDFLIRLSDHASAAISNAELYAAVQAANIAKSEFVSFVSHELKNPMTSIKGYTELLAAGAVGTVTEAQSNFLMTIKTNVERMATLVSDLADISRIEAGRLKLDFKPIQINDIVEEVIRSRQHLLDDKRHTIETLIPANLPNIWADRIRVLQILTNLVSNANKYTPEEGTIKIACEACANGWDDNGAPQVIHVSIADSGIGINPEDQKKIFQKFFRSEDSKAREAPGTGLGLNITMQLVEKQGGKIWFESEFRKGTTFHFTLPVAAATAEDVSMKS